ncbi:MAG: c-type cytochrome [Gammaproteobacteria bacterium]|nr:c-type cytochrome [Gammaproteobacteria bacterium]
MNIDAKPIVLQAPSDKDVQLEEKDLEAQKHLAIMVNKIQKDPEAKEKIVQFGQERTILCNVCHGEDGNAKRAGVPNLAGQNPVYLLDQIQRFSDGRRYDRTMRSLASSFTEDEKIMLALYYSKMEARPTKIQDPVQWAAGKEIYDVACAQCHGERGRGEKGYARLSSQKADYVIKMLKEFRSYTGRRANPWMAAVSNSLNDEEMAAVAAYVSTLK